MAHCNLETPVTDIIRADFEVALSHPREHQSPQFISLVDYTYKVLTQPETEVLPPAAAPERVRSKYPMLPRALPGAIAGLLEILFDRGGHDDLYRLADEFGMEVFPGILLLLIRAGGGMNAASILLMILGTQWYLLFNVIAGAMAIPSDLKQVAAAFRFGRFDRWRRLILPCIFPYLITGLVTAAGGAWNASIIAEYFRFGGQTLSTLGLGAIISQATDAGRFDLLLAATLTMAVIVVIINRLIWKPLYRLSETRFKLET
jgi:ABC-type sugar transport system permease subunit